MLLTTKQVAEKLNVKPGVVLDMAGRGWIHDRNVTQDGLQRHAQGFDEAEILSFAGSYRREGNRWIRLNTGVPELKYARKAPSRRVPELDLLGRVEKLETRVTELTTFVFGK